MTLAQRCGAHGPAREAACAAVLRQVHDAGIEQVRVAWADLHGSYRSKTVVCSGDASPGASEGASQGASQDASEAARDNALAHALQQGVGMVSTLLLKDTADRTAFKIFEPGALAKLPGFGQANNLLLLPDPASFTVLPWAAHTGWLRAEAFWEDGSVVEVDPRRVLQRALAALAEQGYGLKCGLEIEFHIYRITDDGLAVEAAGWPAEPPALRHTHPGYRLLAEEHADLLDEALAIVRRTALGLGLPLRSLEIEFGPSQVEAVFAATDALTAADQLLQFRNAMRQALRRAGFYASFVCKPPLPHSVASGWHLHQSLVDRDGHNMMARAAPNGNEQGARLWLSDAGAHWLAGLLAHAPALAALCAPSIPAYSRFRASTMAPQAAVWGRDNRGAMLRVIGGPGDVATRIENRIGEPMANPYLAIAAQVWAGLHGLQHRLQAPPEAGAPYDPAHPLLPATLHEALQALAQDPVLQQGLGAPLMQVYQAVKQQELAHHAQAEDKALWERCEYFGRY